MRLNKCWSSNFTLQEDLKRIMTTLSRRERRQRRNRKKSKRLEEEEVKMLSPKTNEIHDIDHNANGIDS